MAEASSVRGGRVGLMERNETWRYKRKSNVEGSDVVSRMVFKNDGLHRAVGQKNQSKGHFRKRN